MSNAVVGQANGATPSAAQKKALDWNEQGKTNIRVIDARQFYAMFTSGRDEVQQKKCPMKTAELKQLAVETWREAMGSTESGVEC